MPQSRKVEKGNEKSGSRTHASQVCYAPLNIHSLVNSVVMREKRWDVELIRAKP
jgi:hypothetical protein